jgi:type I restriction enzyme S subunit
MDCFTYVDVAAVDNTTKAIVGERSVIGAEAPSRARKLIQAGDILVSTVRPNLNAVALVPDKLDGQVASTGFCVLRATDKVLPEYIFFFVRSRAFVDGLSALVAGAMYPAVSDSQVLNQELPLPSIAEQRRIVDILSRAEGIVRLRREAQKKAAEIIPAMFLDMFGDLATNPKGLDMAPLGNISEVVSGVTKGRKFNGKNTVMVPYLRVANVQAGFLDLTELKEIEVLPSDVQALTLRYGDVLLTEGGDFDKLGRGALWEHDVPNCIHQNHVFRVRMDNHKAIPEFFVSYLQSNKAREYFLRSAKRTTNLASINMTQLRSLPVPLPPLELQVAFLDRFQSMRSVSSQQSTATAKAEATFAALLGQTFISSGA